MTHFTTSMAAAAVANHISMIEVTAAASTSTAATMTYAFAAS